MFNRFIRYRRNDAFTLINFLLDNRVLNFTIIFKNKLNDHFLDVCVNVSYNFYTETLNLYNSTIIIIVFAKFYADYYFFIFHNIYEQDVLLLYIILCNFRRCRSKLKT